MSAVDRASRRTWAVLPARSAQEPRGHRGRGRRRRRRRREGSAAEGSAAESRAGPSGRVGRGLAVRFRIPIQYVSIADEGRATLESDGRVGRDRRALHTHPPSVPRATSRARHTPNTTSAPVPCTHERAPPPATSSTSRPKCEDPWMVRYMDGATVRPHICANQ